MYNMNLKQYETLEIKIEEVGWMYGKIDSMMSKGEEGQGGVGALISSTSSDNIKKECDGSASGGGGDGMVTSNDDQILCGGNANGDGGVVTCNNDQIHCGGSTSGGGGSTSAITFNADQIQYGGSASGAGGKTSNDDQILPAARRVLVVDHDSTCRRNLEKMLKECLYEVTTCSCAMDALSILQQKKYQFDIVLTEVQLPDINGLTLLEHISLEMDQISVILMSKDDNKNVIMKGVTQGACDYLIKPIQLQSIQNLWINVVRKRKNKLKELDHSGSIDVSERQQKSLDDEGHSSSGNEQRLKSSKRRKEGKDDTEDREGTSTQKKPRVVWSAELHEQFIAAVKLLGDDKAVPKKILELMKVPGLSRENVASHLQKYRLHLIKNQNEQNVTFTDRADVNMDRLDLQPHSVSAQQPLHSNFYHDQNNIIVPDVSGFRLTGQPQLVYSNRQVNLHNGRTTSGLQVNEGGLGHLNYTTRTGFTGHSDNFVHGNQNSSVRLHMAQSHYRGTLYNGIASEQQIISNEPAGKVLVRNATVLNVRGPTFHPIPQPSPATGIPGSHISEFPENYLGFDNSSSVPNFASTRTLQDHGFFPNQGNMQNGGLTFDSSVSNHHGFFPNQGNVQNNGNLLVLVEKSTEINSEVKAHSRFVRDRC